jgi:methylmalonyl-CoA decarboxylase
MELVTTRLDDRVASIIFNHQRKHNAIGEQFVAQLIAAFDRMEQEGALAVVLRAQAGARVWSAGHDVGELAEPRRDPLGYNDPLERLIRRVQDYPQPVIAMVEGSVWGGGCELCIACDMIICGDDSTFAVTPAKMGLPYNPHGLVNFLNVLGPHKAKEMFFTGLPITAHDALVVDMVNHVVPRDTLEVFTYHLAAAIAQNAPLAVRVLKQQFRLLLKGQMLSTESFERIQGMRREVYDSQDYQEGIQAFKEKRKPTFIGR